MLFEPVLMVWDFYDGPRDGLAEYKNQPHYFNCPWDDSDNNYSHTFTLSPINPDFLHLATLQWEIYKNWEVKFHNGQLPIDTHPGHRGNNIEYDQLEDKLKTRIKALVPRANKFTPTFKRLADQKNSPVGILQKLEANWSAL